MARLSLVDGGWLKVMIVSLSIGRRLRRCPPAVAGVCALVLAALLVLLGPVAVPQAAWAAPVQLTSATGDHCGSFNLDSTADGSTVAFESYCDLTGSNTDASLEVFTVTSAGTVTQLSDSSSSCTNQSPSIADDGTLVVFTSDCDLVSGSNTDLSRELFLSTDGTLTQLTSGSGCSSAASSLAADGSAVAFASDCDLSGSNSDLSSEIFLAVIGGATTQLTNDSSATGCDSRAPSVDGDASVIAFEGDCDLTGNNGDNEISEIFQVTPAGVVTQLTASSDDDCSSIDASSDSTGSYVAFTSDCDLSGNNSDGSDEVFRVSASGSITQLSNDDGTTFCASLDPNTSADGQFVVFESYCDLAGDNSDGSREVFRSAGGTAQQLSDGSGCQSQFPVINSDAVVVSYSSSCDPLGTNSEAQYEIFQDELCSCAGPATGKGPGDPSVTDALVALKAAVKILSCPLCACDVNNDGNIKVTDALLILKASVSIEVALFCPDYER